jgi:hypothetical protein
MTGHPYNGGALRLGGKIGTETIAWGDDTNSPIYIALMDSTYTQDVENDVHFSDISTHEIANTGTYPKADFSGSLDAANQLTTVTPYIESTLFAPYNYVVYNANAGATPAYSILWTGVTFTDISGACIFKKGATAATSPLFCFISDLSIVSVAGDKYYVLFDSIVGGNHTTLGIYHRQLF